MLNQGHTVIASFPRRVWGSAGALCLLATAYAGTPYLGNNAILSMATRATVAANGDNHAIATAQDGAVSAVLDWTKFNVGSGQSMTFDGSGTTFFNLVDRSAGTSEINGLIKGSAGSVWVINPAGIAFGASAQVNLDGLFAAAAGNISNAEALRNGTAMLPEFSSFDGKVEVNGSTFTADQVALLGKSVTVNGGVVNGSLKAMAGNHILVDTVAGGTVEFPLTAIAEDPSENTLELGDLIVEGDLEALSAGEMSLGTMTSPNGEIHAYTANGNLTVKKDAMISSESNNGGIVLNTAMDASAGGNIVIDGTVQATGESGGVVLVSGCNVGTKGDVIVNGEVRASGKNGAVGIVAGGGLEFGVNSVASGNVTVNGSIVADSSVIITASGDEVNAGGGVCINENIESANGDVVITAGRDLKVNADVLARSGSVYATVTEGCIGVEAGKSVTAGKNAVLKSVDGDVDIGGSVSGGSLVEMSTEYGDIAFEPLSKVTAGKEASGSSPETSGMVSVLAGMRNNCAGHVKVLSANDVGDGIEYKGQITALGENGKVQIVAGFAEGASGNVKVDGCVAAEGANGEVTIFAGYGNTAGTQGDVNVGGAVVAGKKVKINVYEGTMTVADGGLVRTTAEGAELLLKGGMKADATSHIRIDGVVKAEGAYSQVLVNHGYANNANGTITVGEKGKVQVSGAKGRAQIVTGVKAGVESWGDVVIDGEVTAAGDVDIEAGTGGSDAQNQPIGTKGALTIASHAKISGGGSLVKLATYEGDLTVERGATVRATGSGGEIVLRGGDKVDGKGDILVSGLLKSTGDAVLNDEGNFMGGVTLITGGRKGAVGNISLTKDGAIETTGKDVHVQIGTELVNATAAEAAEKELRGNININGTVRSTGDKSRVFVWSGYGDYTKGDVTISGKLENKGILGEIKVWSARGAYSEGNLSVDGTIESSGIGGLAYLTASYGDYSKGNLTLSGTMTARGEYGTVEASAAHGTGSFGNVLMSGEMDAYLRAYLAVASGRRSRGNLTLSGSMCSGGFIRADNSHCSFGTDFCNTYVVCGTGQESVSSGKITGGMASLGTEGLTVFDGGRGVDATADLEVGVGGEVVGRHQVQVMAWNGNVMVNGAVASSDGKACDATVEALSDDGTRGNVTFGRNGQLASDGTANIVAVGDVRQEGTGIKIRDGYAESISLPAAVDAETINVRVKGDVGLGVESGLAVSGNLRAVVDGNASFAAANGEDFHGGGSGAPNIAKIDQSTLKADETIHNLQNIGSKSDGSSSANSGNADTGVEVENRMRDDDIIDSIAKDFDDMDSGVVVAKGNLSFYTNGKLRSNGFFSAYGDMTVSAASFGDLSYLRAGGKLTINNVGHPKHPRVAYFESLDGREPRINNLPNDMVIFVDGRLAGGNVNIMNMFGANEAFLVSTPELKSTQGIFGDPPFLHSDLDVANPMEVSAIDYLIQEVPRLTLSSEFPADVDQKVEANGLSLKDSYWFGQRRVAARVEDAADGKVASGEEQ